MRLAKSFERLVMQREVVRPSFTDLARSRGQRRSHRTAKRCRDFGLGAQVLADLGCNKIRLMMWSDRKIPGLEGFGIDVVERVPIPTRTAAARAKTGA